MSERRTIDEVLERTREIGFARATDIVGGVDAWREAGLALEPYPQRVREPYSSGVRM